MKKPISRILSTVFMSAVLAVPGVSDIVKSYSHKYSYGTMVRDMVELKNEYGDNIQIGNFGESVEERKLMYAIIGNADKDILFTGGMHAREYIGSVCNMVIIETILKGIKENNPEIKELLNNYRIVFLPMINPDGINLSQNGFESVSEEYKEQVRDIYLYKDLKEIKGNINGVDINRQFEQGWNNAPTLTKGEDGYKGEKPLQEPEAIALFNFVQSGQLNVKAHIGIHSQGEVIYYNPEQTGAKELVETLKKSTGYTPIKDLQADGNFSAFLETLKIATATLEVGLSEGHSRVVPEEQGEEIKKRMQQIPSAIAK